MTSDADGMRLLALADRLDNICDNMSFANSDTRTMRMAAAALRSAPARCDEPVLDEWIEREFSGHGRALRTLRDPPIDGEPFMSMADAKELTRAAVVAFSAPVPQRDAEPVAWIHTLWMELGQVQSRLTHTEPHPFGLPGKDYSDEYKITSTPLYATPPAPPAGEEVRRATIEECAIYLEKIGARYHYGKDLPAHLRALSPSSNGGEEDLVQRNASDASPLRSHPGNGD